MYAHLLCGNREIFAPPWETVPRAASGRPEAIADDERGEEVRLIDSTCEAGEQSGAIRRGVGGGRRWDQEECGTAKHGPDTESGSPLPEWPPHGPFATSYGACGDATIASEGIRQGTQGSFRAARVVHTTSSGR